MDDFQTRLARYVGAPAPTDGEHQAGERGDGLRPSKPVRQFSDLPGRGTEAADGRRRLQRGENWAVSEEIVDLVGASPPSFGDQSAMDDALAEAVVFASSGKSSKEKLREYADTARQRLEESKQKPAPAPRAESDEAAAEDEEPETFEEFVARLEAEEGQPIEEFLAEFEDGAE